jgi:hypothetical protein
MRKITKENSIEYSVSLINFDQTQTIDIKSLVMELGVYYDIFSNSITCELLIKDGVGLIERFPIVGDEKIVMKIRTTGEKKFLTFVFDAYKISTRKMLEERVHLFVLHGVTPYTTVNNVTTIPRSYKSLPISDIVSKIHSEYLDDGRKPLITESTKGLYSIAGANRTPLELISLLSKEAQSSKYDVSSTYLFYEDDDNHHFTTLSSLYDKQSVDDFYLADPSDEDMFYGKGSIKPYQTIQAFSFDRNFDTIQSMVNGVYKNTVNVIDPITRTYKSTLFDYNKQFNELTHISGKRLLSDSGTIAKGEDSIHYRMVVSQLTDNDYSDVSYFSGKIQDDVLLGSPRARHKFLGHSISEMFNVGQYTVNLTIPGNSALRVGNLINVYIPQPSDVKDDALKYLKLFGQQATFLITAMKHQYNTTNDTYVTVLSCTKESFGATIKSELKSRDQ